LTGSLFGATIAALHKPLLAWKRYDLLDFDSLERFLSTQRAIRLFDTTRPVGDDLVEKAPRLARETVRVTQPSNEALELSRIYSTRAWIFTTGSKI